MAVTTPLLMGRTYFFSLSSSSSSSKPINNYTPFNITLRKHLGHKRIWNRNRKNNFKLGCLIDKNGGEIDSWDWNRWTRHFNDLEQAESFCSVLKFQLEEAVEREDFHEAAKLKAALAEASSKDAVAEIMTELKKAIDEERYLDASKLSRKTGSGLVGWWIGCGKDSEDPFGRLLRITPGVGKFIGRSYTPRQLITASPGTTLFEIYVVKNTDGDYAMQVVYLQRPKKAPSIAANLQPKPSRGSPDPLSEDPSGVEVETKNEKTDKQDKKILNIEGVTEDGIKSVLNFIKNKIPGLTVKIVNASGEEEVVEDIESVEELNEGDSEEADDESDNEEGDLDEVKNEIEKLNVEESGNSSEDEKDVEMKVLVSNIVHIEDDVSSKEEYIRLPAEIKDAEKESFTLHVPGISKTEDSKTSDSKVAAISGISELMPSEIAKALLVGDKISPKIAKNLREMVKYAVSQAERRSTLTEYTRFNRIAMPQGKFDPFDGIYVGAFGPYGTELVQLRRKFGHWNNRHEPGESLDVEFFEYVEAVKLTGDLNVPAGQVTFRAKIGKGNRQPNRGGLYPEELGVVASYKGQGRIAGFGFKDPKWVEGQLLQLSGRGGGHHFQGADLGFLYTVPEQSFLVLFSRLNLPE